MISVFTPTHRPDRLMDCYRSLQAQTSADWQWVVLYNNGAKRVGFDDPRVREYESEAPPWVGACKAAACARATGDILLELDHDDLLLPTALERVAEAFRDKSIGFVYSNALHCDADGKASSLRFGDEYGWQARTTLWNGEMLYEPLTFEPHPVGVGQIWFAPNHLRAFRRSVYDLAGGYNRDLRVLDDLDLMCRLYELTDFVHLDEPLYVYRIHGQNAWMAHNDEIQANVWPIYDRHITRMATAWAKRRGLRCLDLGGALAAHDGPPLEIVDLEPGSDVTADLNGPWPFEDSSVGVVVATDVVEHLRDPLHTMTELYRVLAPGGMAFVTVPSTDGRGAFQDPTHVSFWNENSFYYYTRASHAKWIKTPVRFQAPRLYTTEKNADGVCWTVAHLVSLKDGFRPPGLVHV